MRNNLLLGCLLILLIGNVFGQSVRPNEVSVGLGATFPKEKDPLNVSGETEMPTSLLGNLAYRRYFGDLAAVGLRAFGTTNTLSNYKITNTVTSNTKNVDFSLATVNIGLEGILLLADDGPSRPYLSLMVLYSSGLLNSPEMGKLQYQGASFGVGLGMRIDLTKTTALSLEGLGCFGSVKWQKKPFVNSSSDEYNPSTIVLVASVWFSFK